MVIRRGAAPGNVLLSRKSSGLPKPSVANASQIIPFDRSLLQTRVRMLARREFARIEDGVKLALGRIRQFSCA